MTQVWNAGGSGGTGTANVTANTVNLSGSTATGQLNLDGGTLTTGFIHAVNRVQGNNNNAGLTLSGTQIVASASAAPFMSVTAGAGGANQAYIGTGGALFNTSTFSIGIPTSLVNLTTALTGTGIGTGATAGNGFVVVSGSGILTLSRNNTYTGGTTVNQGTLTIGSATGLGATSGPLAVNNNNTTGAGTATVLNLSTTAGTTVGSLSGTIATPASGANTATINNGGQLFTVNQPAAPSYPGIIAGAGGFTFNGASGVTLVLSGSNTYTGATTIKTGTLDVAGTVATSGISFSGLGGNLQLGFGGSVPVLSVTSYAGNTVGTLILGDSGGANSQTIASNLGMVGTNSIVGGASAVSTLTLNGSGTVTFANGFGGAGTNQNNLNLIIAGTGTTPTSTFTGNSTYTGTTTVNSGSTLNLANAVLSNTALTVNSGGILTGVWSVHRYCDGGL